MQIYNRLFLLQCLLNTNLQSAFLSLHQIYLTANPLADDENFGLFCIPIFKFHGGTTIVPFRSTLINEPGRQVVLFVCLLPNKYKRGCDDTILYAPEMVCFCKIVYDIGSKFYVYFKFGVQFICDWLVYNLYFIVDLFN